MADEQPRDEGFPLRTEPAAEDTLPEQPPRRLGVRAPVDPDELLRQTAEGWEGGPPTARDGTQAPPTARILPPLPPPPPPPMGGLGRLLPPDSEGAARLMSYSEHLEELRGRLIKSLIGLAIAMGISFLFAWDIVELMKRAAIDVQFVFTEPTEPVSTYMQIALFSGILLSTPVWLFQIMMFVAPGLTDNEKRFLFTAMPAVLCCFLLGAGFAYFVMLPPMLNFLYHFGSEHAENLVRLGKHVSFVASLLFWIGLVFETPIVIYVITRFGLVTPERLKQIRPYCYIAAFFLAATITPTVDPVNQTIVAVPIMLLFEIGILLSHLAVKARGKA